MLHWRNAIAALALLPALSACGLPPVGYSAPYPPGATETVAVSIPRAAPSISQQFRPQRSAVEDGDRVTGHLGFDVIHPAGTPVIAAADGVVLRSFAEPVYGNQIVIGHGRDREGRAWQTDYRHLQSRDVDVGQRVRRGDVIGTLGRTGALAGGIPHLHFEVQRQSGSGGVPRSVEPHLFWADGVGRVTCREAGRDYPADRITHPVPCG